MHTSAVTWRRNTSGLASRPRQRLVPASSFTKPRVLGAFFHQPAALSRSASAADPNKVARVTDELAATNMTRAVAQETFTTVAGPT